MTAYVLYVGYSYYSYQCAVSYSLQEKLNSRWKQHRWLAILSNPFSFQSHFSLSFNQLIPLPFFQPAISCSALQGTLRLRLTYTLCRWHQKSLFWLQGSSRSISMYWLSLIKIQQRRSGGIVQPHCSCCVVAGIHIILLWLLGGSRAYLHFNFLCCRFKEEHVKWYYMALSTGKRLKVP